METRNISLLNNSGDVPAHLPKGRQIDGISFKSIHDPDASNASDGDLVKTSQASAFFSPQITSKPPVNIPPKRDAVAAAYRKQANQPLEPGKMSDWEKYKDDQLLSNPGGDHYYLDQKRVVSHPKAQESFWGRIGKDVSDAFSNVKNFFHNLLFGAKIRYRDENNQIQEAKQRGLVGSVVDFFKDFGSALTFGLWRPDGEKEPRGFVKRAGFFFSKMKEAIFGDLMQGVSGSVIHMGEDLILGGWNLIEAIPDAAIGNFEKGRKLVTNIFDNGQVVLDYLTDILPSGDGSVRVHSSNLKKLKAPIYYNTTKPERSTEDERWKYVRNTRFRKTIETVGSLLADVLSLWMLGQVKLFGEERHHKN